MLLPALVACYPSPPSEHLAIHLWNLRNNLEAAERGIIQGIRKRCSAELKLQQEAGERVLRGDSTFKSFNLPRELQGKFKTPEIQFPYYRW